MRRSLVLSLVLALCFVASPLLAQSPGTQTPGAQTSVSQSSGSIRWQTNAMSAFKRARAESKPLVVFFFAEGEEGMLPWSQKLADGPLASREIAAMHDRAVFLKVNIDLDDASGNVQRLVRDLNVTDVPNVTVLETQPDALIERGQIVGFHEQPEFVRQMRKHLTHAMIKIRSATMPPLAEAEIAGRVAEVQAELARRNAVLTERATAFRQQLAGLLERGEFDGATFAKAAAERDEAHERLQESIFDLATIPAREAEAVGSVLAKLGAAELDQCRQLQRDLLGLTVEGKLPGPASIERAKDIVQAADKLSSEDQKEAEEALQKLSQDFNNWLSTLAAK